jgi:hypothetical protein
MIELANYEVYESKLYKVLNLSSQITALDWSYTLGETYQFLAIATLPCKQTLEFNATPAVHTADAYELKKTYNKPNFIHLYRYSKHVDVDERKCQLTSSNLFSILNRTIGHVYTLKWRPDFGASLNNTFIGYLLATSSNGFGELAYLYPMKLRVTNF